MNTFSICLSLIGISIGGLGLYQGYYYTKGRLQKYVMEKVLEELNTRMEKQDEQEMFRPTHTKSAIIKVTSAGKTHSIYIPYDRRKSTAMLRKKVYLIKDGEKTELTQKPGVPYMICAADLGGQSIIVEDLEGTIVHTFSPNEIPNCF